MSAISHPGSEVSNVGTLCEASGAALSPEVSAAPLSQLEPLVSSRGRSNEGQSSRSSIDQAEFSPRHARHPREGKKPSFRCNCLTGSKVCGETFTTKARRDAHIESTHDLIACLKESCGLGFPTRQDMLQHMLDEHQHLVCPVCRQYAAHGPAFIVRHRISMHPESLTDAEVGKHQCPKCKKCYYDINAHFAAEHEEMLPFEQRRRFWCSDCGKIFPNLTQHIRDVHKRPYGCPMEGCPQRFGKANDVRTHLISRHDITKGELDLVMMAVRQLHSKRTGYTVSRQVRGRAGTYKEPVTVYKREARVARELHKLVTEE
ncbi:C2H2-type zinc finger [Carpediemonas membranifera]|uniref:C2H2-type zinc finger n=1 Tax=Carpediemonas membranifera TaxID=201153 RepID=A0A8J6E4T0_9EUKA|nr:C2H2-type zinc finger [Carpediemonas membranifera]|eukprot:KAG9394897.1 C2H2-type zinc finger [Carpediemonas membranifera]